jgi:competence ComEA-like helix-hairpin-helix protein
MGRTASFFDFSPRQLKFLAILTVTAVAMSGYLLIKSYALPTAEAEPLPVFLSDGDRPMVGVFQLDPNTAPADSLELLPGIGKTLADRIVAYRQQHRFDREVDITEVRGIGPKLYERIRPYLRIQR